MVRQDGRLNEAERLDDDDLRAIAYFAVGVSSEGSMRGRNVANSLAFAGYIHGEGEASRVEPREVGTYHSGQLEPIQRSGYSLGTLQSDFGQQRDNAHRNSSHFLAAYQDWARAQAGQRPGLFLSQVDLDLTRSMLNRQGGEIRGGVLASDNGYDIPTRIKGRLGEFLESDHGISYVHGQDVAQVDHLLRQNGPIRRLEATNLYREASLDDQVRMATVMAKLDNQNGTNNWPGIVRRIESGRIDSLEEIKAAVPQGLHGDRDNALRGAELLIQLRNAGEQNPLHNAWQSVMANPLVNPTRLDQDPAHPNLPAEYSTVKNLFMVPQQAKAFVRTLEEGGHRSQDVHFAHAPRDETTGLHVAGNDFVQWNRDGHGHAFIDGQWRAVERSEVTRVDRGHGAFDVSIVQNGIASSLHIDPQTPALHPTTAPEQHPAAQVGQPAVPVAPGHAGGVPVRGDARQGAGFPRAPLHDDAEAAVRQLDGSMGRRYDSASERLAASLACLARQNDFDRIDKVVLSVEGERARAGENVFIVQGDVHDPGKRVAWMKTQHALDTPVEQSLGRLHESPQTGPPVVAMETNPPTQAPVHARV